MTYLTIAARGGMRGCFDRDSIPTTSIHFLKTQNGEHKKIASVRSVLQIKRNFAACTALIGALLGIASTPAWPQDQKPASEAIPPATPAAPAPPSLLPARAGPLVVNPKPT